MKRAFHRISPRALLSFAASLMAVGVACTDDQDEPDAAGYLGDAATEMPRDQSPHADAGVPDQPGVDALPPATDAGSGDCSAIGCAGAAVYFTVPDYLARFGAESQTIDITSCYGTTCADARVTLAGAVSHVTTTSTGEARVSASSQDGGLSVTLAVPTDDTAEGAVKQVSLRMVTSTGRELVDYSTSAPVETYCPNGLACGPVCRRIRVQLDRADGGQPVDGPAQASGGMSRKCEQEPAPGDASAEVGDAPVEKAAFCSSCAADELCVVFHSGVCGLEQPRCRKKTDACPAATCSEACSRDMCAANSTCFAAPCPQTALYPQALHCYGP